MQSIKTKITSIVQKLSLQELQDPRFFGVVVLAFIGLLVLWNGASVVQQNYQLLQRITVLEEENRVLELENANRTLQNEYYATPEYAELKARRVNGKAAVGEKIYILTDEVAEQALKTPVESSEDETKQADSTPKYQKNFEAWMAFFFGSND
jgi:cell division protein FtsB